MPEQLINGVKIAYDLTGEGLPLVLVHGFPLSKRMWAPQIAFLGKKSRVLTVDLRGHGDSGGPEGSYSMDLFATDVVSLVSNMRLTPAVFVGHSMGGYVLFRIYAQHRDLVRALVFTNTRAEADGPEAKKKRQETIGRVEKEGPRQFIREFANLLLFQDTQRRRTDLLTELLAIMEKTPGHSIVATLPSSGGEA